MMYEATIWVIGLAIVSWPFLKIYSDYLERKLEVVKADLEETKQHTARLIGIINAYNYVLFNIEVKSMVNPAEHLNQAQLYHYSRYKQELKLKYGPDLGEKH